MRRKIKGMTTEEKAEMIEKMMPLFFEDMEEDDLTVLMQRLMPAMMNEMRKKVDIGKVMPAMAPGMMEKFMDDMDPGQAYLMMSRMMPAMMPLCFSKFDEEHRKNALAMARGVLDDIENNGPTRNGRAPPQI